VTARRVLSSAYHRNGVAGNGFYVVLFRDDDGATKVAIQFPEQDAEGESLPSMNTAVLQVDLLAAGNVAFGENSWRGDHYAQFVCNAGRDASKAVQQ
jgi:hypothetical protein